MILKKNKQCCSVLLVVLVFTFLQNVLELLPFVSSPEVRAVLAQISCSAMGRNPIFIPLALLVLQTRL